MNIRADSQQDNEIFWEGILILGEIQSIHLEHHTRLKGSHSLDTRKDSEEADHR